MIVKDYNIVLFSVKKTYEQLHKSELVIKMSKIYKYPTNDQMKRIFSLFVHKKKKNKH